jgi:hypothetical protein
MIVERRVMLNKMPERPAVRGQLPEANKNSNKSHAASISW